MTAIMQWEIDRARFNRLPKQGPYSPTEQRNAILHSALNDVINNHGTFIVVSTAEKLTIVQRAEAEGLDDEDEDAPQAPEATRRNLSAPTAPPQDRADGLDPVEADASSEGQPDVLAPEPSCPGMDDVRTSHAL